MSRSSCGRCLICHGTWRRNAHLRGIVADCSCGEDAPRLHLLLLVSQGAGDPLAGGLIQLTAGGWLGWWGRRLSWNPQTGFWHMSPDSRNCAWWIMVPGWLHHPPTCWSNKQVGGGSGWGLWYPSFIQHQPIKGCQDHKHAVNFCETMKKCLKQFRISHSSRELLKI